MQKSILNSAIEKYYLGGLIESAKWVVKDKIVYIDFISPNKDAIGKVTCSGFDVENSTFGVYSTSQLIKLVKIMDNVVEIKLNRSGMTPIELLLADNQYDLSFYLSDPTLIDEVPDEIGLPPEESLIINIDKDFSSRFINARKALGEIKQFTIGVKKNKAVMTIGEKSSYSNKIKFEVDGEVINESFDPIPFPVEFFSEILSANKDEVGEIKVYKEGMLSVEFKSSTKNASTSALYFLVRLQEV
jgi:hypothetical protein